MGFERHIAASAVISKDVQKYADLRDVPARHLQVERT